MNSKKLYKLDSVGIVLRQYRNRVSYSQDKIGEKMGVSENFIRRLELGQEYPLKRFYVQEASILWIAGFTHCKP